MEEVWLGRNVGVILCLCDTVLELSGCQELVLSGVEVLVLVCVSGCYEADNKYVIRLT